MKYFRIKNWEKYQHKDVTKHGGPMRWVKLYTDIFSDRTFMKLNTHDRLTWIGLLVVSGRTRNELAWDSAWIKAELKLKWVPNLALFESLGLIEEIPSRQRQDEVPPRLDKRRPDKIRVEEPPGAARLPPSGVAAEAAQNHHKINAFFDLWNQRSKSPHRVDFLTPDRIAKIAARLKEKPDLEYWAGVLEKFNGSPFLLGKGERGWYADFDWFIKPDSHLKILEGKYKDPIKLNPAQQRLRSNIEIAEKLIGRPLK